MPTSTKSASTKPTTRAASPTVCKYAVSFRIRKASRANALRMARVNCSYVVEDGDDDEVPDLVPVSTGFTPYHRILISLLQSQHHSDDEITAALLADYPNIVAVESMNAQEKERKKWLLVRTYVGTFVGKCKGLDGSMWGPGGRGRRMREV